MHRCSVIAVVGLAACRGASAPAPAEVVSSTAPAPVTAPPPLATPPGATGEICEPTVSCGTWSGCVWLERIDATRYRAKNDPAAVFVRRRECYPDDTRNANCAVHCTGPDGGEPCDDGLHPLSETCTGAAVPRPNAERCPIGNGICGSLM